MTAALEPLRSTSFGEAKLAVAEQLCATELEAQTWRLRCFQAEAQLRLHRLHRRGEQHPRWPQNAAEQQQLLNSHASLKALDFTAIVQETLRDLVLSRTAAGHLQDLLEQTSHEVAELEEEAATKRARATSLSDGASAEDSAFAARERELEEEKETARSLAEKLRARSVLENDLAEQVALGQDQVERLQRQIQAFLPSQQQMQQEARQAQQESDKARSLAQRRREAVAKLEEEVRSPRDDMHEHAMLLL
ncbi:PSR1 [Symbiodinium natans]|uniref:PSR1 protein n=1 Tax=Symbiodinium natans TaxID=878477 RepID=A0A812P1M9_9DINO|nr:PSR1 [Symbiodinium natans]